MVGQDQVTETGYLLTGRVYMLTHFSVSDSSGTSQLSDLYCFGNADVVSHASAYALGIFLYLLMLYCTTVFRQYPRTHLI